MGFWTPRSARRAVSAAFALAALLALLPSRVSAQYSAPELSTAALGENYHIEVAGTLWNPSLKGLISSEQFGIIGSEIDLVEDLAYEKTRFKDFRLVLRPSRKSKFRIQYTPVVYEAQTTLRRSIVFNGQVFPISLPVETEFGWKVWRFGYEYDFIYRSRGYVGMLIEGRYTHLTARIDSPVANEFASAKAPLPAIGVVGRAYVLPEVAINFEVSGFKLPDVDPKYKADYFDWDINGTINLSNNFGVQVGWRKMTNYLNIDRDFGDVKFQGLWFGGVARY